VEILCTLWRLCSIKAIPEALAFAIAFHIGVISMESSPLSDSAWPMNGDVFFVVCRFLEEDCAVMELVCTKFRDLMSAPRFWSELSRVVHNMVRASSNASVEELRSGFFIGNEWDKSLMDPARFPNARCTVHNLCISNGGRTLEGNSIRSWKFAKCVKPLPKKEGSYFCYAIDVDRCTTTIAYAFFHSSYFFFFLLFSFFLSFFLSFFSFFRLLLVDTLASVSHPSWRTPAILAIPIPAFWTKFLIGFGTAKSLPIAVS
jgi:hypothetical protein